MKRINGTVVSVTFIAVIAGLVAANSVRSYLNRKAPVPEVRVVVARQNVPSYTRLSSMYLKEEMVPEADVAGQTVFHSIDDLVGRITADAVFKDAVITDARLLPTDTKWGLADRLPDGYRAITIEASVDRAVAGFIRVGHHVDVLMTVDEKAAPGAETSTFVLVRDAEILAIDQTIKTGPTPIGEILNSVTLSVDQEDANRIALAERRGELRLALLGPVESTRLAVAQRGFDSGLQAQTISNSDRTTDFEESKSQDEYRVTLADLLQIREPQDVAVEVIRGIDRYTITFKNYYDSATPRRTQQPRRRPQVKEAGPYVGDAEAAPRANGSPAAADDPNYQPFRLPGANDLDLLKPGVQPARKPGVIGGGG
jgi:pilus assembly protein CpaB